MSRATPYPWRATTPLAKEFNAAMARAGKEVDYDHYLGYINMQVMAAGLRGSVYRSADDGKTWKGGLVLDERKGISYPDGFQAPDGTIYISYDRNRKTDGEVLLARFNEEDILGKKLVGPKSKLKMLISKPLAPKKEKGKE